MSGIDFGLFSRHKIGTGDNAWQLDAADMMRMLQQLTPARRIIPEPAASRPMDYSPPAPTPVRMPEEQGWTLEKILREFSGPKPAY